MLPNALPIPAALVSLFSIPKPSDNTLAVAKKLTVPPIYEAHKHPASRAVASRAYGMATKRKDTMHPSMEPILPAMKGSIIPRMVLLIVVPDLDIGVDAVVSCDDPVNVDIDDDDDDAEEDRRANTSDAGKNTLQHQSYRK
mmetsp:Transcript_959/g.2006  ORF Transcript_959/g.2006 Transcript_959/m.2006 type:complete len:141 (-) Transcript_959:596-1018(-)